LLLTRRQRMAQAFAGPWAEWLVTSVAGLVLWFAPAGSLTPLLHRFVVLNSLTVVTNLFPFVGLDGSWILADLLRIPDLSRRSRAVTAELIAGRRLPASAEEFGLAAYAFVNVLVAVGLLALSAVFWWALFGSSAQRLAMLGPLGWLALLVIGVVLLRPALIALSQGNGSLLAATAHCARRVQFRLERRWRVRATWLLHGHALAGADEHQLGVVAGLLSRHRIGRLASLTCDAPSYVVVLRGRVQHGDRVHQRGAVLRLGPADAVAALRGAVVASVACHATA